MGYLDYAGLQHLWDKLKETFAPNSHNHDDRYYTESEMDSKLNSKVNNNEVGANDLLSKLTTSWTATPTDDTYFIRQDTGGGNTFGRVKFSTIWNYIKGKADGTYQPKGSYAVSEHTHDDRYYTETEINTKLNGKANSSHTHTKSQITDFPASLKNPTSLTIQTNGTTAATYDGSAAKTVNVTKGNIGLGNVDNTADADKSVKYATNATNATTATKLSSNAGSNNQPVYFSGGKPVAIGYTIAKSVPADAKFTDTNTWRGIQNNLTSDSTDQSLSAAQGKALKTLVDGKAPTSHKHTRSQITDFPTSMPASDVSAWAKAPTKPTYTKAEVGLGNVDNTADKDKNVKYATLAEMANSVKLVGQNEWLQFSGTGIENATPDWVFGGSMYGQNNVLMFNPSQFSVNYATTAGTALTAKNLPYSITYEGSYVGTACENSLYNNHYPNYATETNPVRTTLSKEYDVVVFLEGWGRTTNETCPEKYAFLRLMDDTKFTQSYVVMSALTNEWTRGLSRDLSSGDVAYGPVIEYNVSPKKSIKYRKNGTSIERYWTRESIKNESLGEPGSANNLNNGAYMLLDRPGATYHVFGIDIDHRFFVSSHADEEGSEVV